MRGNHRLLGPQDYTEPPPLATAALARIATCSITPRTPGREKPHNWHEVRIGGALVGFVTTRLVGQCYRTPEMSDWFLAAGDWNRADPPHGHAVSQLLEKALPQALQTLLGGHVLSIKDGAVFDKARTPGQSMVQAYVEVFKGDNSHG